MPTHPLFVLLLFPTLLLAQAAQPRQVLYQGAYYWYDGRVDTMNNTPYKLYYMYDTSGKYLGWRDSFPQDGQWIRFFKEDSTRVASIFDIQRGLPNGKSIQYDLEGRKRSAYDFTDGELNGFVRYWSHTGILTLENEHRIKDFGHFLSSVRVGEWITRDQEGRLLEVSHFRDNEPHGAQIVYYDNGQVETEAFFVDGLRDSLLTSFHPNGQIKSQLAYNKGVFVPRNPHREFHANGALAGTGDLEEGRKTGHWTYFHDNGVKASEGEYGTWVYQHEHGDFPFSVKKGSWTYWFETGVVQALGDYDGQVVENMDYGTDPNSAKALRKGTWQYFNRQGQPVTREVCEQLGGISDY